MKPAPITNAAIESDNTSKVEPSNENMSNSNSPSSDWISSEAPNPVKKLKSCPEKIPETAVAARPLLAKLVIDM